MAKVAVNGFGRVGRMFIRAATELDLNIVAINYYRPLDIQRMAYMLKYDSVQGRFRGDICYDDKHLIINDKKILIFSEKDVNKIPWSKASPQYLVECTGKFKTMEKAKPFLKEGIKKVIISAPSKDAPMFVMGVNSHQYNPKKHHIVSNASCTTNCLAPLAKVVHENFGICEGLMTTVHAVTPSQKVLDGFTKKKIRDGRCAILNIIPASTGAAKAVGKVIPELKGKLTGMAFRVPIADASVVDLTVGLERPASLDDLKCVIKDAARCSLKGILAYTEELIVSTDVIGTTYSSIFDASASMALNDKFVKLVSWYDNEYGYVCRLVDFVKMIHKMETCKS